MTSKRRLIVELTGNNLTSEQMKELEAMLADAVKMMLPKIAETIDGEFHNSSVSWTINGQELKLIGKASDNLGRN